MEGLFNSTFFTENRQRLLEVSKDAELIVIPANSRVQKNADEAFPFRQDSSFWYFTGLDIPDALLVLDISEHKQYVILPYRDSSRDQWETAIVADDVYDISGIKAVYSFREGLVELRSRLKSCNKIHSLMQPSRRFNLVYGIQPNPGRSIWNNRIHRMKQGVELISIRDEIKDLRIIKQKQELTAITRAIQVTESAFDDVQAALPDLNYEYEVRAVLHAGFESRGANRAFDSVVASGQNAALLHYEKTSGKLNGNDLLLIDAGACLNYYAADITRVFMPSNGMSTRQHAIYSAVVRTKDYAASIMKPGVKHREYEQRVREFIGEELIKLGLIKRLSKQGIHRYFPSMTSHHLGLDVHDIANYDETFEEGMVLTIEPGIYVQEEGIGVRIEDDVVITKTGIRVLSEKLYN